MEGSKSKLTNEELDVLDELVFSSSYEDLQSKFKNIELKKVLKKLLSLGLIYASFPAPDDEILFENEIFNKFYSEYYYLATKSGLKHLFG